MADYGPRHSGRIFYVLYRPNYGAGLFSNVFHVLGHLRIARDFDFTPVVDMEHFPTLYNEKTLINGTKNAWEYYFEQPSPHSLSEVYDSRHVILCDGKFRDSIYDSLPVAHDLAQTYLKVRPEILAQADAFWQERLEGHAVLGVHFRGQEQNRTSGHAKGPTIQQMLGGARDMMARHRVDRIFIVSEERAYIDVFKKHFGEMVVYTKAFRTYDDNAYAIRPHPRELHMYKLGLAVLLDTLLLSRCAYLLAHGKDGLGGSNVSRMAQVLSNNNYTDAHFIDNGIIEPQTPRGEEA